MDLDNSNNVYLAYLNDSIQGIGNGYRICITKVNGSGCQVWEKKYGKAPNAKNMGIKSIKVDSSGNVYVAGFEKNSSGNFDWFVIKYNSTGGFIWRKTKNGTANGHDVPFDITFDNYQNPIVVGNTKNTGTNKDITLVKYNKLNGSEAFTINYDSNNKDECAYNVVVDGGQSILVNGILNSATQTSKMIALKYCFPPAAAEAISGSVKVCQGAAAIKYTVPEIENATSYSWTLPSGATGISNTNSILVSFGSTSVSGNLTVKGVNNCSEGATSTMAVEVSALPAAAGQVTGATEACQGQQQLLYSVPPIANANKYVWSYGGKDIGTTNNNSVYINFGTIAFTDKVSVRGQNDCGDGLPSSISVKMNALPSSAGSISGLKSVCTGQGSVQYTVPTIASATDYIWTLPDGSTKTTQTNSISIDFSSGSVSGELFVKGQNGCGEGTSSTIAIAVTPKPTTPSITLNGNALHSDAATGNKWYDKNGPVAGATAQVFTPKSSGDYYVVVSINGCTSNASNTIKFIPTGINPTESTNSFKVYPNPVTNELTLEFTGNTSPANFEIINSLGQVIHNGTIFEKTTIKTKSFASGVYIIKLEVGKTVELKKIIKY